MFWHSWSTEAFQRAHTSGRPVLLSLVTGWSAACAEMEANVFAQPAVAAAIEACAVPVRVDADVRPDLAERYGLGGWPTTVWLTPDGEMLTGGTYLDADVLIVRLREVAERFQRDRAALQQQASAARAQRRAAHDARPVSQPAMTLDDIRARVLLEYDEEHAGFGHGPKFPLSAPILFALRTADPDLLHIAATTLDRIAESEISDPATGAFFRAADRRWGHPDRALLLDVQSEMIALFLEAAERLQIDAYRARALAALEFVHRDLRTESGAYRHYPNGPILTDSNARLIRCFVQASHLLGDTQWTLAAVGIAEHLLPITYARASGVAHYVTATPHAAERVAEKPMRPSDSVGEVATSVRPHLQRLEVPRVFGLSADTILMASALLDLGEATGQSVYIELAEELTRSVVRRFWDPAAGALVDRLKNAAGAGDVGLLGESVRSFGINVEAARLLGQFARRTGDVQLHAYAEELRRYVGATAWDAGILSSDYGLLLLEGLVVHSDSGG